MTQATTTPEFFENMYQEAHDPWGFATSAYELGRYSAIVAALAHKRYRRAFEPACSVGVLTSRLAALCEVVEAIDCSLSAVREARERCRRLPQVWIARGVLPQDVPEGSFDLIVFSEVGYYFEEPELRSTVRLLAGRLCDGGVLLAAHWLGTSADHLLSGDRVHEILSQEFGLQHDRAERHVGFRLDRWVREPLRPEGSA